MRKTINDLCAAFPNTVFIYKALLPTNIPWLNTAITEFNLNMFQESIDSSNYNFFDCYFVNKNPKLLATNGHGANGIHISRPVGEYLSSQIICHITHLHHQYSETAEVWPIRPYFRDLLNYKRSGGLS